MGDIADYYMDIAMQHQAEWESQQHFRMESVEKMEKLYMMGVLKWNTQNDGRIMVTKMTKNHLTNTIEFIKRNYKGSDNEIAKKWIELLNYELEKR